MKYTKWLLVLALLGGGSLAGWQLTQATVSSTAPRNDYVGTGSVSAYDYTFRIFANSDLRVTTQTSAGVVTPLVLTTDYTVTGANNPNGGTITLVAGNLASGTTLTIRSDRTPQQATNLRNQGTFRASTHETKFDELTRYAQQLTDVVGRALHFPETDNPAVVNPTLPSSVERASKFLAFDASGNPIASAGGMTSPPVTAFATTLLDDASASVARTTLGAVNIAGDTMTGNLTLTTASSPRLSIGTTHASNRTALLDFKLNGTSKWLLSNDQLAANVQYFRIYDAEAALERLGIDSAGVVYLGAGRLAFPASQNASSDANTLDDYEKADFTPSVGGTATYTTQEGKLVKIGRLVCLNMKMTINAIGTGSQTTILTIPAGFLPVAGDAVFAVSNSANLATTVVSISGYTPNGGNSITLRSRTAAAAADAATAVLTSGSFLALSGCYQS